MSEDVTGTLTRALSDLAQGEVRRVERVEAPSDLSARLAGLGVSVGREVRLVKTGNPLVVQVYGTRLGIARSLAQHIRVGASHED